VSDSEWLNLARTGLWVWTKRGF